MPAAKNTTQNTQNTQKTNNPSEEPEVVVHAVPLSEDPQMRAKLGQAVLKKWFWNVRV